MNVSLLVTMLSHVIGLTTIGIYNSTIQSQIVIVTALFSYLQYSLVSAFGGEFSSGFGFGTPRTSDSSTVGMNFGFGFGGGSTPTTPQQNNQGMIQQ